MCLGQGLCGLGLGVNRCLWRRLGLEFTGLSEFTWSLKAPTSVRIEFTGFRRFRNYRV